MKRWYIVFAAIVIIALIVSTYFFMANYVYVNPSQQTLKVFCATSLLFPFEKVEADFETAYPNVDVEIEGHGSGYENTFKTQLLEQRGPLSLVSVNGITLKVSERVDAARLYDRG